MTPPVRLLAMNWSFDLPLTTVHRICGDRVFARGDNHQSLHADAQGRSHEEVIWMFLQTSEELLDNEVDESIEMDVEESLEDALARAVDGCVRILGLPKPSVEKMGEALQVARGYAPTAKRKTLQEKTKDKSKPPRYYALMPEIDLERVLEKHFKNVDAPSDGRDFYHQLAANKRIADRPHITIVHEKGLPADQVLWDRCQALFAHASPPAFSFKLGHIVWNGRVMAVTVSDLAVSSNVEDQDAKGVEFVVQLPEALRKRLHITVGTRSKDVNPVEARDLVADWNNGVKGVKSLPLKDIWANGRVKGLKN